jgi:iron complex outermembrane recepter protein
MPFNGWSQGCARFLLLNPLLAVAAVHAASTSTRIAELSLEELGNIEVTSVSKRGELLSNAAASVFVITGEDIRRAGVTSLPEALRLAPNLQVARVSANEWAISSRGFNSQSANKLLVLVDGRSVYSPLFSGVFWEVQDMMLEDVERIEVLSGPGGTLWGVNAVNGVINVITRAASATQGGLLAAGGGNQEAQAAFRHGGQLGENGHFRVYGKQSRRSNTETSSGRAVDDNSHASQVGFSTTWRQGDDSVRLQGDAYRARKEQPLPGSIVTAVSFPLGRIAMSGGNLVGRWERRLEDGESITGLLTYDRVQRTVTPTFSERLDILDAQLQHAWRPSQDQRIVWGFEYRYARDRVDNSSYFAVLPANLNQTWVSLFAQDEISLGPAFRVTIGARAERNDYTGGELLPNLRLAWNLSEKHLLWAAASRAVRAPSRLDRDTFVPGEPPYLLAGGPDFRSEVAKVYELGYRAQPASVWSYAVTVFHSDYDHLHTQELAPSGTSLFFSNRMEGRIRGLELWSTYQASKAWRLHLGYDRLWQDFRLKPDSRDTADSPTRAEGSTPGKQLILRSAWDLPAQTDLNVTARYVSRLSQPVVPSYHAIDLRLGWRPTAAIEVSIACQNLFAPKHGEFSPEETRSAFGRSVYLELLSRF